MSISILWGVLKPSRFHSQLDTVVTPPASSSLNHVQASGDLACIFYSHISRPRHSSSEMHRSRRNQ